MTSNRSAPVLANSIPKTGTHLLKKCLSLFPGLSDTNFHVDLTVPEPETIRILRDASPGDIVTGHLPAWTTFTQLVNDLRYKSFIMTRDPRDTVVSFSFYVTRFKSHFLHDYYNNLPDDHARFMATIQGIADPKGRRLWDIGRLYTSFMMWSNEVSTSVVRFEDLVGERGGGTRPAQVDEITSIARHLGMTLSQRDLDRILKGVYYKKSPTFRKGIIGDWKNHLSEDHLEALSRVAPNLLDKLGYAAVPQ